jgi:ABC-2 type transport system permease protein
MVAIKVSHLSYTYPGKAATAANSDISFEVQRGEIFGLLGPNGAGKTTLISQILGLIKPHTGAIWLENIDIVQNPDAAKRMVGFLPQTGLPMRYVEVEQALRWTGRLRGQAASAAQAQADTLIEQLEMSAYARKYVNKLSGGMLRLVNFAMSLMGEPPILILDEPTNELDPQMRRRVWDMIACLNRERGTTCILVTHNVLEAERVIQRVAVMKAGRIVALGTPGELKLRSGGKVRLEFRLKEGETLRGDSLAYLGDVEEYGPGAYRLYLASEEAGTATDRIVRQLGLERLEDFRLAPPSLEDVYLGTVAG